MEIIIIPALIDETRGTNPRCSRVRRIQGVPIQDVSVCLIIFLILRSFRRFKFVKACSNLISLNILQSSGNDKTFRNGNERRNCTFNRHTSAKYISLYDIIKQSRMFMPLRKQQSLLVSFSIGVLNAIRSNTTNAICILVISGAKIVS